MKAAVQVLKQAEELKTKVSGDVLSDNEAWTSHQKLQDLYQQLLIMDLEYALDKKVEQDLWNYVFKNPISSLQNQAKDKKNPRRSESQGNLAWFLEAASGFYLQLLQELCDTFELDLPCRRKGSIYGIIKSSGSKPIDCPITPPHKTSCLYICQHCLVHLGDIARYRNQSLQAETFYRHAAQLVPSNGQPYNQLAILEAAKGEKLSTVFYYVRSIAVKHPFPVASTNLQKMFSKIASDDISIEGKAKLSVYDYINTFLQFHSLIHMTSDLERAQKLLKVLSSNLSTLVATENLTTWKMIQMTAINLFAITFTVHELENQSSDKKEFDLSVLSEEEQKAYNLMLELTASTLNGLLLLVYTMKDDQSLKDYYALPIIKLILDWLKQDSEVLKNDAFANKLQIWPSLCKLLNGIQNRANDNFDAEKYEDVPLPEDWDLQCFVPLNKTHRQYRFKETTPRLTEEEETKLRSHRLVLHGQWICNQEFSGKNLMTLRMPLTLEETCMTFEAITEESPSTDVLMQLEEVSVSKIGMTVHSGYSGCDIQADSSSNNSVGSQETSLPPHETNNNGLLSSINHNDILSERINNKYSKEKNFKQTNRDKSGKGDVRLQRSNSDEKCVKEKRGDKTCLERKENARPNLHSREKKMRQNVAMQTIMQKKNIPKIDYDDLSDAPSTPKAKLETKQVTFKTPSPSPPASSEGTPPQTSASPQTTNLQKLDMMNNFPPLQAMYSSLQIPNGGFGQTQKALYNIQNQSTVVSDNTSGPGNQGFPSNRMVYSSLPAAPNSTYPHGFNVPQNQPHGNDFAPSPTTQNIPVHGFRNQLKEAMALHQATGNFPGNRINNVHTGMMTPGLSSAIHQQSFLYGQPLSPVQQKPPNYGFNEGTPVYGQQLQWFQPPLPPQALQGVKTTNLEQLLSQNQVPPRPSQVPPQQMKPAASPHQPPPPPQSLSSGSYPIYPAQQQQQQAQATQQRGQLPDSLVFQMQTPQPIAYTFQSSMPSRISQPAVPASSHDASNHNTITTTPKLTSQQLVETEAMSGGGNSSNEVIANTYSLFSSPWSSGLNLSPAAANEGMPITTGNAQPAGPTNFGGFIQPGLQSLWSGPGPSPLERLLEQQKQKRDAAPQ